MNVFISVFFDYGRYDGSRFSNSLPPHFAKAVAASFPLGSIRPYRSCSTVYISPTNISAEVPVTC